MSWALIFWFLCFLADFGLLAIVFHELLAITDLEADHLNPFEATLKINKWIIPEFVAQGVLSLLFLVTGHWLMFLLSAPLTCYHAMLFVKREHLLDVTEVFRNLNYEKKSRIFKLGFYLLFFSIFVFRVVAGYISVWNSEELDFRSSFIVF